MTSFVVQMESEIPYYQQIVDAIHADVERGELAPGEQLPTVRALADTLGLACGTIKRAYDELEKLGDIERTRGRGTFVRCRPVHSQSHVERATDAIDRMLDELAALGLSAQEAEILLQYKLAARKKRIERLRVAFVECNREVLSEVAGQLRTLEGVELERYLLSDVIAYPYTVSDEMDVIVTTAAHYDELLNAIPAREKLLKVALRLAPEPILSLAKLANAARVGVLCCSVRFSSLIEAALKIYAPQTLFAGTRLFDAPSEIPSLLDEVDALLVPEGYEAYCQPGTLRQLSVFSASRTVVTCRYEIDQGSYMYLDERVESLRRARGMSLSSR